MRSKICLKLFVVVLVLVVAGIIYAAVTEPVVTDGRRTRWTSGSRDQAVVKYVTISDTNDADTIDDFTVEVPQLANTVVDRITIDANGTDTSFKVYLYDRTADLNDTAGIAVFSKTDCTTASVPYNYSIVLSDVDGAETRGAPLGYPIYVTVADGDDSAMDQIEVTIYYRQEWQ